jgi:hypothetical protein
LLFEIVNANLIDVIVRYKCQFYSEITEEHGKGILYDS